MTLLAKWAFSPERFLLSGFPLPLLIGWLNRLLVVLLAYTVAQLTWLLVQEPVDDSAAPLPVAVSATMPAEATMVSLEKVAALHLLGRSDEPPPAEPTKPIEAPETRLNLTLRGLVALDSQEGAHAIIAQGSGDEQAYKVGATVPGGATLHEIMADRVILERGGRFETLTLPKEKMALGNAPQTTKSQPRVAGGRGGKMVTSAADTRQLRAIRDRVMNNPQEAMRLINAQPVMDGGQLKGYRVSPGRDRALFSSVGLRPGDIVTSVNGIALNDMSQMGALFQQLSSAARLDVTIERRGQQTQLSLALE